MLEVRDLHSFYGDAHVIHGVSIDVSRRARSWPCSAETAWARPPSSAPIMGLSRRRMSGRQRSVWQRRGTASDCDRTTSPRARSRSCRKGGACFPRSPCTEHLTMLKQARATKAGPWSSVFELFPRLARAAQSSRRPVVRRRAPDAGGRPRADDRSRFDPDGRAVRGLAPVMVQHLEHIVIDLRKAGLSILLVEQNLLQRACHIGTYLCARYRQDRLRGATSELAKEPERLFGYLGVH